MANEISPNGGAESPMSSMPIGRKGKYQPEAEIVNNENQKNISRCKSRATL
jgi:hypothetical protein